MSECLSQAELESYLWGAATVLRGLIDAGDYKQYVFPLLFYKRLSDVWDADYAEALAESGDHDYAVAIANDRFVIPEGAHWNDVRATARDVGRALQDATRTIEAANPACLEGIFGDAPWTNKDRLPDATLKNLIEHFSKHTLSLKVVPEDELGNAYEYLINKFADDSGHTAQEFYTNRTVVHLMVQMLVPQSGERIYDPTCGTGGMLISALAQVKQSGGEHRTLGLFGQERNHMTASIARMNLVLHGVGNFAVARGDTLERPAFLEHDQLATFDVVLANPPYSIKQWNRTAWMSDAWGRNFLGTPPQGRADYAFFQHILSSMDDKQGRCAILFPHGVLFRKEEAEMRRKLIEMDLVECVLGLGPNLFYNSPMEACVLICRSQKPPERQGRILFIDAVNEVARERAMSFLRPQHQARIVNAYRTFADEVGFAQVATLEEIAQQDFSLSIPLYVKRISNSRQNAEAEQVSLSALWANWEQDGRAFWQEMDALVEMLDTLNIETENRIEVGISIDDWPKPPVTISASYKGTHQGDNEGIPDEWYEWLDLLPLAELRKLGKVSNITKQGRNKPKILHEALEFYNMATPSEWHQRYDNIPIKYRQSMPDKSNPYARATWLRLGELEASQKVVSRYHREKFETILPEVRKLTLLPQTEFMPRLDKLFADAGVMLILIPSIKRARVSGAARWLQDRPMIQMSLYGKKNDRFWFTLLHEMCHILNHEQNSVYVDDSLEGDINEIEREADLFAEEILIPSRYKDDLPILKTSYAVEMFAKRIGIHPGIVVGRLQHLGEIDHWSMNELRETVSLGM